MVKWWHGVAAVVAGLVGVMPICAQMPPPPMGVSAGPMPGPMGYPPGPLPGPGFNGPMPGPGPFPGPMPGSPFPGPVPVRPGEPAPVATPGYGPAANPLLATFKNPVQESPFSLSDDGRPNAWNDDGWANRCDGWFTNLGAMGLFRTKLGNSVLAVRDPRGNPDLPSQPPKNSPVLLDFDDLQPRPLWGMRGAIGYRWNYEALELAGYHLFRNNSAKLIADPGRIDLPFAVFNPPFGFSGNNNLWLNADLVREHLRIQLTNAELNLRTASFGGELIFGLRYLDYDERFGVFTNDDDLTLLAGPLPVTDPKRRADYTLSAHSHLIAPQYGVEWENTCTPWLALGFMAKGALGVNFLDVIGRLERGDDFAQQFRRSEIIFSYLFEGGVFLDLICLDQARLRLGYQFLWLLNVPQAHGQLDFDIAGHNLTGIRRETGDIFFHGPMIELQIQW